MHWLPFNWMHAFIASNKNLQLRLLLLPSDWRVCCRPRVWATSFQIAAHPPGTPNAQRKQKPQLSQYPLHLTRNPTFCQTSFYKSAFSSSSYKKAWRGDALIAFQLNARIDCRKLEFTVASSPSTIRVESMLSAKCWATSFQIALHPHAGTPKCSVCQHYSQHTFVPIRINLYLLMDWLSFFHYMTLSETTHPEYWHMYTVKIKMSGYRNTFAYPSRAFSNQLP